jgi:protein-tyrosine phosphatase
MTSATPPTDPARAPAFEGAMNFRDLGGYETVDGRRVRHGRFFRSGLMSELTDADIAAIRQLEIRSVCDFRAPEEREAHPSRWFEGQDIRHSIREDTENIGNIAKFYEMVLEGADVARSIMTDGYRKIPYMLAPSYRAMFDFILAGHVPIVFHCTVGKDRTGIASALLLTALGVPRERVVEDFRATDRIYDRIFDLVRNQARQSVHIEDDSDIWPPLLLSDPAYLDAMYDEFTTRHGGIEGYLHEQLGVDAAAIDRLRQLHTE